ncbi:MAG: thiamine pyrophosphate-binding protein, partial [Olsenella sp.]
DITGVTLPITKHNYFVRDVTRLQDIVCEAFKLANSGRKGPVLVDIPADVQRERVPYEPKTCSLTRSTATPDPADLEAAAAVINKSKRPFVYFGGGVVSSGAGDEVIELANLINAPIGCSLMGISGIPTNTPRFLGMEGMHGHYASTKAMSQCDCLIALGARFNDRSTGDRARFAPSGKVVRVDIDSSEFSKTLDDRVEILGDVKTVLQRLIPLVETNTHEDWNRQVRELRAEEKGYDDYRATLTPKAIMDVINERRDPAMPVVTDVGQHQMWAAQYLSFDRPRSFITSGGLGTMGFGLGAAEGATLATGEHVILITGDGSFAMNMAELITAVDNRLPITVVLLNNHVLGMVRQMQSLFKRQRYSQTTLDRTVDYVVLAQAF